MKISFIFDEHREIRHTWGFEIRGFFSVRVNSVSRGQLVYYVVKRFKHIVKLDFEEFDKTQIGMYCTSIRQCTCFRQSN